MKNKAYIIIAFAALTLLGACKDFLEDQPESVLTQVNFYTTPARINQGVMGCYAGMATALMDEWKFTESGATIPV
jgi:hypothetical protein